MSPNRSKRRWMISVNFLSSNREEFHQALNSVTCAANGISSFMQRADETDVIAKTAHSLDEFKKTLKNSRPHF